MSKTQKVQTLADSLVEAKLAAIQFHNNVYVQTNIAKGNCFTAHNALQYKTKLVADQQAATEVLSEQAAIGVAVLQHEKAQMMLDSMLAEIESYKLEVEACERVYKMLSGKDYSLPQKK
jgi:hypothetical protein